MTRPVAERRHTGGALLAAGLAVLLHVNAVHAACPLQSAYDVTVTADALLFDRASGAARRIEVRNGGLSDRGKAIAVNAADRDRLLRFERTARSLVPRIRQIGLRAVDIAAAAIREEAALNSPRSAANPQLAARLDARTADLKARIAKSNSSKDWRGQAFNRYTTEALGDVLPLVGGDIAQAALDATMRGDFNTAARMAERGAGLRTALESRVRTKLAALQPTMDALCPGLRSLDDLEAAVTAPLADGTRLDLLQVGGMQADEGKGGEGK